MKKKADGKKNSSFGQNKENGKLFTSLIAAGLFIIYIIISLLLAQGNVQKFIIILLLLGVITLCAYFIYVIMHNEKKKDDQEREEIEDVTPRRVTKPAERPELAGRSDADGMMELGGLGRDYGSRERADARDGDYTDDGPMALDTNNVRKVPDRVIIRKADPSEEDLSDYRLETGDVTIPDAADTVTYGSEDADTDDDSHYVRKTVERPAFQGFVHTRSRSETLFSGSINNDATLQAREAFNAAKSNAEAMAAAEAAAAEAAAENAAREADEAAEQAAQTAGDAVLQRAVPVQDKPLPKERVSLSDKYKSGPGSDIYKESYDSNRLFRGGVDVEKPIPGSDQKNGYFTGKGYKSPFDKKED